MKLALPFSKLDWIRVARDSDKYKSIIYSELRRINFTPLFIAFSSYKLLR